MKSFKQQPLHSLQQSKPSTLNTNIESVLGEFNGKLDGSNMPIASVDTFNLVAPVVPQDDVSSGQLVKRSSKAASQAYHMSKRYSNNVWLPELTIDLKTDQWTRGWNKLHEYSPYGDFPLTFDSVEGMLTGCAVIDWHHGVNRVSIFDEEGSYLGDAYRGYDWWTEWGVFVNNVLVARSGLIYPRRHTTQLPFSIPVGSQPITIDVRFITNTTKDTDPLSTFAGDPSTVFDVFGAEIWARNTYR